MSSSLAGGTTRAARAIIRRMSKRVVHCIQHSDRVRPLTVAEWAAERGLDLQVVRVDREDRMPVPGEVERLVVLGGGMNSDQVDEHPWLVGEADWLRDVVDLGRAHVLGICLGSQLLAHVLGGTVGRAAVPEIGWQRIERTGDGDDDAVFASLPGSFDAMQWHGDAWTVPPGGRLLATSTGCAMQAFGWGDRVRGVQFHPEFTYARTRELARSTNDDLTPRGCIQAPEEFLAGPARFDALREVCVQLLDGSLDVRP